MTQPQPRSSGSPPGGDDPRGEQLSAWLDGELSASERAEVDAALAADPALRAELEALSGARAFLAEHGPLAAPPELLAAVLAAADAQPVVQLAWYRRPFGVPWEAFAVAAAAALVILVALPRSSETAPAERGAAAAPVASSSSWDAPKKGADAYGEEEAAVADGGAVEQQHLDPMQNAFEPPERDLDGASPGADAKERLRADAEREAKAKAEAEAMAAAKAGDEKLRAAMQSKKLSIASMDAESAKDARFFQVPYSYAIHTEDPGALVKLAAIAASHQGELTDTAKAPLEVEALSGTDAATVLVRIPGAALKALGKELAALGSVYTSPDNAVFTSDPVEVRVTVRLSGGASEPASARPAATRKAYDFEANEIQEAR